MPEDALAARPARRRVLALGLGAAALARPAVLLAQDRVRRLRLAHALPATHPVHPAMEGMAEEIASRTGGAIRITLFANGELGDEIELMENTRTGALDMTKLSASVVERVAPAYRAFNMPFLFRDRAHLHRVVTSPIGREFLEASVPAGLVGLTFYDAGSRSFYAQKPIAHPDDLKGLKIRIQLSPSMSRMIALFEAQAVQLPWHVVHSALQTGLVDGAENSVAALIIGRHGEVARYYCFDEHTMVPDVLMVSARRWAEFSPAEREIVSEAAQRSFARMVGLWTAFEAESMQRARSMGITFTYPEKRPFMERVAPMRRDFADDPRVHDIIGRIEQIA
jgi:tripartite ATP-independent transporter DctP family solute receptor